MSLTKSALHKLYIDDSLSVAQIARQEGCSQNKVNYWLAKFAIPKRSISDAVYLRLNPNGDPFKALTISSKEDAFLAGLGLGLYWGEGTKKNMGSVRLGNTDPDLIRIFLIFLSKRYEIEAHRLRFGLQIFSDMDVTKEEKFWIKTLKSNKEQFYRTVVTSSGSIGTYREKSSHGVLTIYFHNKKLRDLLIKEIDNLRLFDYDAVGSGK